MIHLEMQGQIFASGLLRQLKWLYGHGSLGFTRISVGSPSFLLAVLGCISPPPRLAAQWHFLSRVAPQPACSFSASSLYRANTLLSMKGTVLGGDELNLFNTVIHC